MHPVSTLWPIFSSMDGKNPVLPFFRFFFTFSQDYYLFSFGTRNSWNSISTWQTGQALQSEGFGSDNQQLDWTEHFIHDSDSLRGWENYFVSGHKYNDTYRLTGCSILSWWSKCPRSKSCACSRRTRRTRGARRTWQAWQSLQQEKNPFSKFTTIYGVFRFLLTKMMSSIT